MEVQRPSKYFKVILDRENFKNNSISTLIKDINLSPESILKLDFDNAKLIYVPVYKYDSSWVAFYSYELGENYETTNSEGKAVTRTRWKPGNGEYNGREFVYAIGNKELYSSEKPLNFSCAIGTDAKNFLDESIIDDSFYKTDIDIMVPWNESRRELVHKIAYNTTRNSLDGKIRNFKAQITINLDHTDSAYVPYYVLRLEDKYYLTADAVIGNISKKLPKSSVNFIKHTIRLIGVLIFGGAIFAAYKGKFEGTDPNMFKYILIGGTIVFFASFFVRTFAKIFRVLAFNKYIDRENVSFFEKIILKMFGKWKIKDKI